MEQDIVQLIHEIWVKMPLFPWHWIAGVGHVVVAPIAAVHAMLYKRDPRAALGWVSVCLFFPVVGPLFYFMFGINRIHTQAHKLSGSKQFRLHIGYERGAVGERLTEPAIQHDPRWNHFVSVSDSVSSHPLLTGNDVEMLQNGEQAFPSMLAAINAAKSHILMVTYLFETDEVGHAFVSALIAAQQRGVKVRVIVDGVGEMYSRPRMSKVLRQGGVHVARFLPPKLFPPSFYVNLRNHRKILVVDGVQGFTGGMNIGARHLVDNDSPNRTVDVHFHVQGPVVKQLQTIFCDNWRFTSGEKLTFDDGNFKSSGSTWCRCISDGPDDDMDKIAMVMMGAISAAKKAVTIVTPYFLPSQSMIASLLSAALRGVDVAIILPQKSNLPYVDWATRNLLWEILQHDVKVYYQPPPFAHTKLFLVDDVYAQVGSANQDPRSLRLNFELNLEIIGAEAVAPMIKYAQQIRQVSHAVTLKEVDERPLPVRMRDAACWLFMPYL